MLSTTMDVFENNMKENKKVLNYFDLINKIRKEQKSFKMSDKKIIQKKSEKKDIVLYFGQQSEIGKNINFRY